MAALSPPSIHPSVCLSTFSSSEWLFSCGSLTSHPPSTWCGTLGPLIYPRSGSRVERVREGGKRATTALWVGSASFTEVSQNKSGSHYVSDLVCSIKKQHLATSRQPALYIIPQRRKSNPGFGLGYTAQKKALWKKFKNRHTGRVQTW